MRYLYVTNEGAAHIEPTAISPGADDLSANAITIPAIAKPNPAMIPNIEIISKINFKICFINIA